MENENSIGIKISKKTVIGVTAILIGIMILGGILTQIIPSGAYDVDANGEVNVLQASDDFYRYIDYTPIVTRFFAIMDETIQTEWKIELDYLRSYDQIRKGMREIVDLPEKKANQFIVFVRNNNGVLSKAKRDKFAELTDDEIHALEGVIRDGLMK